MTRELKEIDTGIARLYEAVEKGLLPLDTTLQERSQKLQARRQDALVASGALRDKWEVPHNKLTPAHVQKFTRVLRTRLLDTASGFGKAYLNLLVDEIRLDGNELHIKGSDRALARAVSLSKEGKLGGVPSFVPEWRPEGDSNPRRLVHSNHSCRAVGGLASSRAAHAVRANDHRLCRAWPAGSQKLKTAVVFALKYTQQVAGGC